MTETELELAVVALTAALVLVNVILAIGHLKVARIAEREFRAARLPNVTVRWRREELATGSFGHDNVTRHHFNLTGELQSMNNVELRVDDVTATATFVGRRSSHGLPNPAILAAVPRYTGLNGVTGSRRLGFTILVGIDPDTDYRTIPVAFVVRARFAIAPLNGTGTEMWAARIEVAQTGPRAFHVVDNARGRLYRERDQSYYQRTQARFQEWKREMLRVPPRSY